MLRYRKRHWLFATALSALAGYADANAFVNLGGFFVSFMSGNSTRLGVGLVSNTNAAALATALIGMFVVGVMLGAICNRGGDRTGGVRVLAIVSALLTLSAILASAGRDAFAIVALVCAMGAMNGVFQREGEVTIGVTYMTGTLVRMGQRLAAALTGGLRWAWTPYLLLWMGLVAGAALGALAYAWVGLSALWAAAGAGVLLTAVFWRLPD